ncbi:DNA-binding NtrC family response regulator [Nitrobacteraceae bacterium AZCC 2161]
MKRFPDDMIEAALQQSGQHTHSAARVLGCSHVIVWQYRKRRGDVLKIGRSPVRFPEAAILAAIDRSRGDLDRAAAELGCSTGTIRRVLPPLTRKRFSDAMIVAAVARYRKPTAAAWDLGCCENLIRVRMHRINSQQVAA